VRISEALSSFSVNTHYTSIIGQTGAGKTSVSVNCGIKNVILIADKFINIATDEKLKVNKSLSPCTTEFAFVRCTFEDSREVVFVDTPPYPHPDVNASTSEEKVGKAISKWVKGS
jgi:hypothetical protein